MEKEQYTMEAPPYDEPSRVVEQKGMRMGEAADVYGDIQTAEDYGYVSRGYVGTTSQSSRLHRIASHRFAQGFS